MKTPTQLVEIPTVEEYVKAFRKIEKGIEGTPHELLLRALHSATTYRTEGELAKDEDELASVHPVGGRTARTTVDGQFKSLGRLIRDAMSQTRDWEIHPRYAEFKSNKQAYWATIASCYREHGLFRFRLLPQVAEALEQLDWVPRHIPKPTAAELAALKAERETRLQEILSRPGQGKFRDDMREAYQQKCAITDCDAVNALEAAHIVPFAKSLLDHPSNGLLLRADIHTLFDLYLIGIEPQTLTVKLSPALLSTTYKDLQGKRLSIPADSSLRPSQEFLGKRWALFSEDCAKRTTPSEKSPHDNR